MKIIYLLFVIFIFPLSAKGSNTIRISGSATMYQFITIAAEQFANLTSNKTPIVEITGTGRGINLLCSKHTNNSPDIISASRKITKSEQQLCTKNLVNINETLIGSDALILTTQPKSNIPSQISTKELMLAIAAIIPSNNSLVKNYYKTWKEINPNFPNSKILIYGPSFTSGTRDALTQKVLLPHCLEEPIFIQNYPNTLERKAICKNIRQDNSYIEIGDNDNSTIQKILTNNDSIGVIGYNFFQENKQKLRSININKISPEKQNILSKTYPLTKELYLYYKQQLDDQKQNTINEFIKEISSEKFIGKNGYLTQKGFIPYKN